MPENNITTRSELLWILRLEGLMVFIGSIYFYNQLDMGTWKQFALLFFLPDISLLGYLGGKKIGAIAYNTLHTYVMPLGLGLFCHYLSAFGEYGHIFVIWIAHIGFDRALGFGLKSFSGFKYTHLGTIGKLDKN